MPKLSTRPVFGVRPMGLRHRQEYPTESRNHPLRRVKPTVGHMRCVRKTSKMTIQPILCCACREPNIWEPEKYSQHDPGCSLDKYRCNKLECAWCDLCDSYATPPKIKSRIALPPPKRAYASAYESWKKVEKPRPPTKEALDLPTAWDGSFEGHFNHVSDT